MTTCLNPDTVPLYRQAAGDLSSLFIPVCEPGGAGNPHAALPYHRGGEEYGSWTWPGPGTKHRTGCERKKKKKSILQAGFTSPLQIYSECLRLTNLK